MTWLWWAVPLVVVDFLWTLNEFLRGRLKQDIAGALAFLSFALVGVAFVVSGWKVGLGALLASFLLINLYRPVALALAKRLTSYPDLGFDEYEARRLRRMMIDMQSGRFSERCEQERQEEALHRSVTISTAMTNPAIIDVLQRLDATARDLEVLYDQLEVRLLPPWVRREVLHNPGIVAFFLEHSSPSTNHDGSYTRTSSLGTRVRLHLWTHGNPSGDEPDPRR